METAVCYHNNALPILNHILAKTNCRRVYVASAMRLRPDLTLKRVSADTTNVRRNSRIFRANTIGEDMATKSNQETVKEENIVKKEEEEEEKQKESEKKKKKKILPPPPEKPEAGDCCGSGCVRCVWDVYYEELDAYNKLYQTDSYDNSKSN